MESQLYHYSEDPTIERFVPRSPAARPEVEPFVWAIDAEHSPLYYFPRDCPRVSYWPLPETTTADRQRFFGAVEARMVIAIEWAWFDRLRSARLARYRLPAETFEPIDPPGSTAFHGVYVSRTAVLPLKVEVLDDLLVHLQSSNVELRLCSSLRPLNEAIIASTLHYSCIRMRNTGP